MILTAMTRRTVFQLAGAAAALPSLNAQPAPLKGRLKQSAARWCYSKMSLDDLAREGARIGLQGIDLIDYKDWPTAQKYGLVPAMTPGAGTIGDGFNRKENHDRLVREMEENIPRAAAAKVPNVITFSGNRRGQSGRRRHGQLRDRAEPRKEARGRQRRDRLHGAAEQQDRPPRLSVRPHRLGRGT